MDTVSVSCRTGLRSYLKIWDSPLSLFKVFCCNTHYTVTVTVTHLLHIVFLKQVKRQKLSVSKLCYMMRLVSAWTGELSTKTAKHINEGVVSPYNWLSHLYSHVLSLSNTKYYLVRLSDSYNSFFLRACHHCRVTPSLNIDATQLVN